MEGFFYDYGDVPKINCDCLFHMSQFYAIQQQYVKMSMIEILGIQKAPFVSGSILLFPFKST